MNLLRTIAALVILVAITTAVIAHDTWLLPQRFSAVVNTTVLLDLTSGMAFPALETSIKPDRIDRAQYRLAGQIKSLSDLSPTPTSLRFETIFSRAGIATCWVELKPKSLDLTPKLVHEYLNEIDAPAAVRQQWATAKEPRRWREMYTKHAKTFIRVGELQPDGSWAEPVGMSLEIVPETDPTQLRRGMNFPVRVFENGQPLANFPLGIIREGSRKGAIRKTDHQGRVRFLLGQRGRWLLRGTKLRKAAQPEIDWESDFTTLTVNVK